MATIANIATRVLQKLKVLENGESIDSGDQTLIEEAYGAAYVLLEADELVTWGSADDIPTGAELPIIDYVANRVKSAFIVPQDVMLTLPGEAMQAEKDLFLLTQGDYVHDITPANYY